MRELLVGAALDALATFLPIDCGGCGSPDRALCSACRAGLAAQPSLHELADGTPVVSALRYEGVVRHAILAYKEQGRTDLARVLSTPMLAAVECAARVTMTGQDGRCELCTVPPHGEAWRRRGYRPVELMLRSAGLGAVNVLEQVGTHGDQKSLGRLAREQNLGGSLRARRALTGRRFIAVDDILTTGATLAEVVRAVREAGGELVCCATLAFTPRLFPRI